MVPFQWCPYAIARLPIHLEEGGRGAPNRWIALGHRNRLGCFMTMPRPWTWDDFKKEHWASPFGYTKKTSLEESYLGHFCFGI